MVVSCCVINCTTRFNNSDPKSFYRVPKKPDTRRQLWISAIKREGPEGKPWEPADHDRVCYQHFITGQKSNDKTNPDYVPSIHMGGYEGTTTNGQLHAARFERFQKREADKDQQEAASVLLDISENLPPPKETTEDLHGPCIKKIAALRIENELLHEELGRLQAANITLRKEVNDSRFGDQAISSDRKTLFYTGVPNKAIFMCAETAEEGGLHLMMELDQHYNDVYKVIKGIPKLAEKLSFLVQWPDKDNLIKNMPVVFKLSYPRCISIIDCFEVFIQRPANLTARAQTWSSYKHRNTIKFLVSITPTGAISFVSKAFGGRTSDKVITQRSGFLDKLEHGDQVLAYRGFLIAEELASRHASLVIPAFTKGKSQLSAKEVEQTRKIAHVRIHVERAIEQLKNFNILSSNMSIYLVPHSDSIVTLCSAVCNLHPKLVSQFTVCTFDI
ncbi:unnamed protein product [Mytilus coruscus]|uniref:THAP-type domain-containing protein n=1 Tax=Mytilus coruscus TaxID=42192 RepID=A0A6J8DHW4_MYTCO|nr:unnamed protein product [Mytilus coruscus]